MPVVYANIPTQLETIPPSSTVRVFRDSDKDIKYRECLIVIDDLEVGNVAFRRNLEFKLEPGPHWIQATNRVRKTQRIRFEIKPGERITFQVGNTGGAFYEFLSWMQVAIPHIFLEREEADFEEHDLATVPECWNLG